MLVKNGCSKFLTYLASSSVSIEAEYLGALCINLEKHKNGGLESTFSS